MRKISFSLLLGVALTISNSLVFAQNISNETKLSLNFEKSDQIFEFKRTFQIKLKDLDNDGDLDAVCANMGLNHSQVLMNDGKGNFSDSGQQLTIQGHGVGIEDLNNDGSPDIFITCAGWGQNDKKYKETSKIYFNDGNGNFKDSEQDLGDLEKSGNAIQLVDIDSDNDFDAIIEYYGENDVLYLNNGNGYFSKSDIIIPDNPIPFDIDMDGDIDIFCREEGFGFRTLLNNNGQFSEFWTLKDTTTVYGFATHGDIDNDSDLDIILTNGNRNSKTHSKVFINNGDGSFTDSGQKLSAAVFGRINIGDLNGDNTLDVIITSLGGESKIWLNNGKGDFSESETKFESKGMMQHSAINDINNDGYNDIFISNFFNKSNEVWLYKK